MILSDAETEIDYLNYKPIADTVSEMLMDTPHEAVTIGIHGDWGAGKSSILKMIETNLKEKDGVSVLWFNGWTFQGFDDAKTVMMESVIGELMNQRSTYANVKDIGESLLARVNWMKLIRLGGNVAFNLVSGMPSPDQLSAMKAFFGDKLDTVETIDADQIKDFLASNKDLLGDNEEKTQPHTVADFRSGFVNEHLTLTPYWHLKVTQQIHC